MTKNNKRFADRETVVKGFIINTATQEFTPFEETISYARSTQKAVELVREKMQLDNDPNIIVTVNEIVNEAPKQIKYNDGKVYELAITYTDDENEAQKLATENNAVVRKIAWYKIDGQVWYTNIDGQYFTCYFEDTTPINMTKCDARAFVALGFEMAYDNCTCIGIHNVKKRALDLYCVIDENELAKCIES